MTIPTTCANISSCRRTYDSAMFVVMGEWDCLQQQDVDEQHVPGMHAP
jgi:hypothetical protein